MHRSIRQVYRLRSIHIFLLLSYIDPPCIMRSGLSPTSYVVSNHKLTVHWALAPVSVHAFIADVPMLPLFAHAVLCVCLRSSSPCYLQVLSARSPESLLRMVAAADTGAFVELDCLSRPHAGLTVPSIGRQKWVSTGQYQHQYEKREFYPKERHLSRKAAL